MNKKISREVKELLSNARLIAIDLKHNYISTIHLFLADCSTNGQHSVRNFAFRNEEQYQHFYKECRNKEVSVFDRDIGENESLPLTLEAEQTIREAAALTWYYADKEIRPYHIFLAGARLPQTFFYEILKPKEGLAQRLEDYYLDIGRITRKNIRKGLLTNIMAAITRKQFS